MVLRWFWAQVPWAQNFCRILIFTQKNAFFFFIFRKKKSSFKDNQEPRYTRKQSGGGERVRDAGRRDSLRLSHSLTLSLSLVTRLKLVLETWFFHHNISNFFFHFLISKNHKPSNPHQLYSCFSLKNHHIFRPLPPQRIFISITTQRKNEKLSLSRFQFEKQPFNFEPSQAPFQKNFKLLPLLPFPLNCAENQAFLRPEKARKKPEKRPEWVFFLSPPHATCKLYNFSLCFFLGPHHKDPQTYCIFTHIFFFFVPKLSISSSSFSSGPPPSLSTPFTTSQPLHFSHHNFIKRFFEFQTSFFLLVYRGICRNREYENWRELERRKWRRRCFWGVFFVILDHFLAKKYIIKTHNAGYSVSF